MAKIISDKAAIRAIIDAESAAIVASQDRLRVEVEAAKSAGDDRLADAVEAEYGERLWAGVEAARRALTHQVGGEARLIAAWNAYADWADLPLIDE